MLMRSEPALEPREDTEAEAFAEFIEAVLAKLPTQLASAIEDLAYMEDDAVMKALRADWADAQRKGAEQ